MATNVRLALAALAVALLIIWGLSHVPGVRFGAAVLQ